MLNLPNLKTTAIFLDGERFDMRTGTVGDYRRTLNLRDGILRRSLTWKSPGGKTVKIETTRLVSFALKHILAQRVAVTPLDFDGEVKLLSVLDGAPENHTSAANPLIDYGPFGVSLFPDEISAENGVLLYRGHTKNSGLSMACGSIHVSDGHTGEHYEIGGSGCSVEYTYGGGCVLDKFIAYASSLDAPESELKRFVRAQLENARGEGFKMLCERQKNYTRSFWNAADIEIDGDDAVQQGLRFNMFHVLQSAARDGRRGMGAKGLSGEGYEGHYFWDTEIYAMPMFTHTLPEITRSLLNYRYNTLDAARERARELGHEKGALYPWRTINGAECSTYMPLGTAQYHINADIAYAFSQYVKVTNDLDFYKTKAAEVLCETARIWADVGCFVPERKGKYCICSVTGPDEYTALTNNNFYTNLMARENLKEAAKAVTWLRENDKGGYEALRKKIGLSHGEAGEWLKIADKMELPYDKKARVYLQDDGFHLRRPWDETAIPPQKRRLLYENYHPLYIWRQRMNKQADTVLALLLHSNYFDGETIGRHYDFYLPLTLHHSTLSKSVFGIAACMAGRKEDAEKFFRETARTDIDDAQNNFKDGIHAANMAGSWLSVVYGFAGLRTNAGKLELSPFLPRGWNGYRFRLTFKGSRIEVSVREGCCTVRNLNGETVEFTLYGRNFKLNGEGFVALCGNRG
jgi:alpha,alpha-trehalose phosphorylase